MTSGVELFPQTLPASTIVGNLRSQSGPAYAVPVAALTALQDPLLGFGGSVANVQGYGAVGDGVTDDTAAINLAIVACKLSHRALYFPAGTYLVTSALTAIAGQLMVFGDGRQSSTILFRPTANAACFTFSNGASQVLNCFMRDLGIKSDDTTHVKVAIDLYDLTTCGFSNIYIYGTGESIGPASGITWHDSTNASIGIRTHGRDSTNLKGLEIIADYPIYVAANPNAAAALCEDFDHWHLEDLYLLSARHYLITVADGLGASNLTIDGYQAWVGGTGGFFLNDTRVSPTTSTHNLMFKNIRTEQCLDANGYFVNATFVSTSAPGSITFDNDFIGSASQGVTITKGGRVTFKDSTMAQATGKNALVFTPYAIDSVVNIQNTFWQPSSVITLTDMLPASIAAWEQTLSAFPTSCVFTYKTEQYRQWIKLGGSGNTVSNAANTNEQALATVTVPAKFMGANGCLRVFSTWQTTGNNNTKDLRVRFSSISGTVFTDISVAANAAATSVSLIQTIQNANSAASQVGAVPTSVNGVTVGAVAALPTSSVDTDAADTTIVLSGQLANSSDGCSLKRYEVMLLAGG